MRGPAGSRAAGCKRVGYCMCSTSGKEARLSNGNREWGFKTQAARTRLQRLVQRTRRRVLRGGISGKAGHAQPLFGPVNTGLIRV
ncbi:hypothetical protein GCM10027044_32650 [Hymenobacter ruber]